MPASEGFRIVIEAKPNSKTSKIMEINEEYVGVAIAAPPKEGEANEELIYYLAQVLRVKKNRVYLDKGCKSRHKVAMVGSKEITMAEAYERLKEDIQS